MRIASQTQDEKTRPLKSPPGKKRFFRWIRRLEESPYEASRLDKSRYIDPSVTYAVLHRERFYYTLRSALRYLENRNPVIVDFGVYPGTLLRIAGACLPELGYRPRLIGAGLLISPEFRTYMKSRCSIEVIPVNLDPGNPDLKDKNYPHVLPAEDNSVDLIFATEIIEHLTCPLHMLHEANRLLKPGAILTLTTPNITRIGNVFKLLVGRSTNDRLAKVGYANREDEWRPHVREYSMEELQMLLQTAGFRVQQGMFLMKDETRFNIRPFKQKLIDLAKVPFYLVPHLRGDLLIVAAKTAEQHPPPTISAAPPDTPHKTT